MLCSNNCLILSDISDRFFEFCNSRSLPVSCRSFFEQICDIWNSKDETWEWCKWKETTIEKSLGIARRGRWEIWRLMGGFRGHWMYEFLLRMKEKGIGYWFYLFGKKGNFQMIQRIRQWSLWFLWFDQQAVVF